MEFCGGIEYIDKGGLRYESEGKGEKGSGGMGLWGSQSKFVVGCDKIRSGRLIERRSGDVGGRMQEGGKPNPSLYSTIYAKGINSFKKCE